MKKIGLIGGMSWQSTVSYYQVINREVSHRLGALHSAKVIVYSVDFAEIESKQMQGDWDGAAQILVLAAQNLVAAGADLIMLGTNTMHLVASQISEAITVPFLHIADATGQYLQGNNFVRVGLLGTRFTMQKPFLKHHLSSEFGIDVLVPSVAQQNKVHQIIYQELCLGKITDEALQAYQETIDSLQKRGAQAIVLGCTEIGLLIKQEDFQLPICDTAEIHAKAGVNWALGDS